MYWILIPCGFVACLALGTDPKNRRAQNERRAGAGHGRGISRTSGSYAWSGRPSYKRAMPSRGVTARPPGMSCPPRALPRRAGVDSGILPWLPDVVDDSIIEAIGEGMRDVDAIATAVLRDVYPVTTDGEEIPWPTVPTDAPALGCMEERVKIRVRRHVAALCDMEADYDYPHG